MVTASLTIDAGGARDRGGGSGKNDEFQLSDRLGRIKALTKYLVIEFMGTKSLTAS